jgi:hypothetical protein
MDRIAIVKRLNQAVDHLYPEWRQQNPKGNIITFNDDPLVTHEMILAVAKLADV